MEPNRMQLVRSLAERYTAAWRSQDAASVAAFYDENGSLSVAQASFPPPARTLWSRCRERYEQATA